MRRRRLRKTLHHKRSLKNPWPNSLRRVTLLLQRLWKALLSHESTQDPLAYSCKQTHFSLTGYSLASNPSVATGTAATRSSPNGVILKRTCEFTTEKNPTSARLNHVNAASLPRVTSPIMCDVTRETDPSRASIATRNLCGVAP